MKQIAKSIMGGTEHFVKQEQSLRGGGAARQAGAKQEIGVGAAEQNSVWEVSTVSSNSREGEEGNIL